MKGPAIPLQIMFSFFCDQQLQNSLNDFGEQWNLNPGDGAFYGPKVSKSAFQ